MYKCLVIELPKTNYSSPFEAWVQAFPRQQIYLVQVGSGWVGVGGQLVGGGRHVHAVAGGGGLSHRHTQLLCMRACTIARHSLLLSPLPAPACSMRTSPPGGLATRCCTTSRGRHMGVTVFPRLCGSVPSEMWIDGLEERSKEQALLPR